MRLLARTTGIFTETAGGVTTAVLRSLAERGAIGAGETVVAFITGDGLKTIDAVQDSVDTIAIPADPDAVDAALGEPVSR
jgi:threonine synthase